jgi:hypothetical protein
MPDYGHDLRLGAFLTPQARRPRDVVALAQLSEQSGLDLVTFQDHARPERLHDAFPGPTLKRLQALQAVYDPDNVFNQNSPIVPASRARKAA